jgi:hypothetical protein
MKDYLIRIIALEALKKKARDMYLMTSFHEPVVCKHFGCGKKLSAEETMYGDYCQQHSVRKEVDIINVIRFH